MKIKIFTLFFFLVLILFFSYSLPDLEVDSIKLDHYQAGLIDVMEIVIKNIGDEASVETTVVMNWSCGKKVYKVRALEPGDYATLTDLIYFPDAGYYEMAFHVDPLNKVQESNENNNEMENMMIINLPTYYVEEKEKLDLESEKTPVSCEDTDLMKIGRKTDENGSYVMENGKLSRDISDENVWLPDQEGNGCGSTSLAYILRYMTGENYTQEDVDPYVRMTWGDGTFSDPFMIKNFVESRGINAEIYIDGSAEKLEWFIDRNIPTMVMLTTDGSTDVTKAHWVVPVGHCIRPKKDGLGFERVIAIYNPWGYQHEISYEKFMKYWGRMDLGGIPLWNRVYIAFYKGNRPNGMPSSNIDSLTDIKMNTAKSISEFLVAFQRMGDGFADLFGEGDITALWDIFAGFAGAVVHGIETVINFVISLIGQIFSWIGSILKKAWCWFIGLFGADCDGTPHYYLKTFFSSDSCGESAVFLNGLILKGAVGYISDVPSENKTAIYLYARVKNETGDIIDYILSSSSNLWEREDNILFLEFLGYSSKSSFNDAIDVESIANPRDISTDGNLGYISKMSKGEFNKPLWLFEDNNIGKMLFMRDRCGNTRTFPIVISKDKDKPEIKPYTRDQIVGYVYVNEDYNVIPLYRFYDSNKRTFFITNSLEEGIERGYSFSSIVGYLHNKTFANFYAAMQKVCGENETELYRYYDKEEEVYTLSTYNLDEQRYVNKTFLGCIKTCPSKCTSPLWIYANQEIIKK